MILPQSNARLISITRGGLTEDYDEPAGDIAPVWQGLAEAYAQRVIRSTFDNQGELRRTLEVTLIVSGDLPVQLRPGDTVTYYMGNQDPPVILTARVQTLPVNPAALPGLPDYYKVALEEVNA